MRRSNLKHKNFIQWRILFAIVCLLFLNRALYAQVNKADIFSPDKNICLHLFVQNGQLNYKVDYRQKEAILPSALGLVVNGETFGTMPAFKLSPVKSFRQQFEWRGVHNLAREQANQVFLTTDNNGTLSFKLEFLVFNNGVAFRYLCEGPQKMLTVTKDLTTYYLPAASMVWWQGDIHNYEGSYLHTTPSQVTKGQPIGTPMTVEMPGTDGYAAILEGGLRHFAGMHLSSLADNGFSTALAGDVNLPDKIASSWRIIALGKDLNALVNNDIPAAVSDSWDKNLFPQGLQTPWIKPGKSVWSWMTAHRDVTVGNMRKFTDWASALGIPYNLVDDGWGIWKENGKDYWQLMKELVDYSAAKGVHIWAWKAYPDNGGIQGLKDSVFMAEYFKKAKEVGIVGLKIDFMSSESQDMVAFCERASRMAAQNQLMIDFHGIHKPTGASRTWPNVMTVEAVRGLENSGDTAWPLLNTVLPFTRYLAGPGDYTPLSLAHFVSTTTLAHQVATMATFTSPFLCLGVEPADLLESPALDMVKAIPATWDETIVLPQSKIGQLSLFARRKGDKWFLAVLNGEGARNTQADLSFLKKGKYKLQFLADDPARHTGVQKGTKICSRQDVLDIQMPSGGGYMALFEPVKK